MEELFNRVIESGNRILSLKGIVQNEGVPVSQEELYEWNNLMGEEIYKLIDLRSDITNHFARKLQSKSEDDE